MESKLFTLLRDKVPCAVTYYTFPASRYGNEKVYKIKHSVTVPEHYVMYDADTNEKVGTVRNNDPYIRFFNTDQMELPRRRAVIKVKNKAGVTRVFHSAKHALENRAVCDTVRISHDVCLSEVLWRIFNDMPNKDDATYMSLSSLSHYLCLDVDDGLLLEYWDESLPGVAVRHFQSVDSYYSDDDWYKALLSIAVVMGWEVQKEYVLEN